MKVAKDYVLKLGFVFKEILKAGPGVFFLSIGSMIITGVSPVITTYLTAKLIEELGMNIGNETSGIYFELLAILLGMLGVVVISFATEGVKTVICSVVGLKLSHNIENHIAEKFQSIKQERIDDPEFLNLHSNTLTKSGSEPLNLMEGLFGMIANLISLVGYAGIIIKLNLWAFLIIMVFTLPIIVYKRKYQGMLFRFFNERTMQMRRIWYYLSLITDPQYCKEIREFRLYSYFRKRRKESFDDFMKGNSKIAAKEILVSVITSFISMIGAILVGVWLIKNTLTGIVSVSDFYLFVTAIITIVTKLIALSNQIASNSNKDLQTIDMYKSTELSVLDRPVIAIAGLCSGLGKWDVQLSLLKKMKEDGLEIGAVSNNPIGLLYDINVFAFPNKLKFPDVVYSINRFMYLYEINRDIDAWLVNIGGAIDQINMLNTYNFGKFMDAYLSAANIDIVLLCINPSVDIDFLKLEVAYLYKHGVEKVIFVLSHNDINATTMDYKDGLQTYYVDEKKYNLAFEYLKENMEEMIFGVRDIENGRLYDYIIEILS